MHTNNSQEIRKRKIDKLIEENKFKEVYDFVKSKVMYLHVAIDTFSLIYESTEEDYLMFARVSPAFTNMVWKSIICGIYTNFAELIKKDTIVGVQTLIRIATTNRSEDANIKENSDQIITLLKDNDKMLRGLFRFRNKEICHFDEDVLNGNTVVKKSKCLKTVFLKQFLNKLEKLLSQLRLSYMNDGIYDTMCPMNSHDSNNIKDILNTYYKNKKEIIKLKNQRLINSN